MQGLLKDFLRKLQAKRSIETRAIYPSCNEHQRDIDPKFAGESATRFNKFIPESKTGIAGCCNEISHQKRSCPNIGTCLIILLLFVVFLVLPVVYLLHCFNLLNGKWPEDELKYIVTDHSHPNPKQEPYRNRGDTKIPMSIRDRQREFQFHTARKHYLNSGISALPAPPIPTPNQCSIVEDRYKFDCYPEDGASEEGCRTRGCCWKILGNWTRREESVSLSTPFCFYPNDYGGYKTINSTETGTGITTILKRMFTSPYPEDVPIVKVDLIYWKENSLRVKVSDPSRFRYEPPVPEVPTEEVLTKDPEYKLKLSEKAVEVLHKFTNTTILKFSVEDTLIFADQFLQISVELPAASSSIYGLGEHRSTLKLSYEWQRFTLFNHDRYPAENTNLYGSHPFYLLLGENKKSSGLFLRNSNAMEVILQPTPAITFRTIGGIFDFFVFFGPSPAEVVQQYQDVVGRPFMPPYWGLGFHLCRFGYKTLNHTKEILENTKAAGIPIDVQWLDLDYMNDSNDFTYDKKNFAGLPEFIEELHKDHMYFVPLIDPGISAAERPGTYPPYDMGLKMDIFVKNSSGKPFVGKVWNRFSTVWPDFTNPSTTDYWLTQLKNMHDMFAYDGAWIDMNEPSNFYSGTATGCPNNNLDHPPYVPAVEGGKLFYNTLCMSAKHYDGSHYNLHNLYGLTEAIATNFALAEIRGRRPFIISRSTFSGLGHFAGHWSGDVYSTWYDMKKSVSELLSFSFFGIPLMGADICGFNGNTTAALCQRWSQLGAFYPFSRNHNTDDGIPQDPVSLGPAVVKSARRALLIRYRLLPYLYTLFWRAHAFGDTVARPLFFEFPHDVTTHSLDEQFLWGSGLMIVPVLEEGVIEVSAYLPDSVWYDLHTMCIVPARKEWYDFHAPLDTIPLLIRGGSILPAQAPNMTTTDSRKNDFELIAAADENGHAEGSLYWDDGDSLNTYEDGHYNLLNFTLNSSALSGNTVWYRYHQPMILDRVFILGILTPVTTVFVNNVTWPFSYNTATKHMIIKDIKMPLHKNFTIYWA